MAGAWVSDLIDAIRTADPEEADVKKQRAIGFAMATVLTMKILS